MKININNLGKIGSAVISPRPFTLFIGKNGSGKTYCASAIWAVIRYVGGLQNYDHLRDFQEFINFLKFDRGNHNKDFYFQISNEKSNKVCLGIQNLINRDIKGILQDSIGFLDFSNASISIERGEEIEIEIKISIKSQPKVDELLPRQDLLEVDEEEHEDFVIEEEEDGQFSYELLVNGKVLRKLFADQIPLNFIRDFLSNEVCNDVNGYSYFGLAWKNYKNSIYLPAARTGIMLAINYYVEGALQRASLATREKLKGNGSLPLPLSDFAKSIYYPRPARLRAGEHPLHSVVQGKITQKKRGEFGFQPDGCDQVLPLNATSSLVTELAGFYLLGDSVNGQLIIFEEPEAHLHLEAQREIAKYLAHLVSKGAELIITTHSDTFLQQINNLIALSDHPMKSELLDEFNIKEDEVLDKNKAVAYEFFSENNSSQIKELIAGETGFVADSLNDVLIKLAQETYKINSALNHEE